MRAGVPQFTGLNDSTLTTLNLWRSGYVLGEGPKVRANLPLRWWNRDPGKALYGGIEDWMPYKQGPQGQNHIFRHSFLGRSRPPRSSRAREWGSGRWEPRTPPLAHNRAPPPSRQPPRPRLTYAGPPSVFVVERDQETRQTLPAAPTSAALPLPPAQEPSEIVSPEVGRGRAPAVSILSVATSQRGSHVQRGISWSISTGPFSDDVKVPRRKCRDSFDVAFMALIVCDPGYAFALLIIIICKINKFTKDIFRQNFLN